jgi:hypothetical protein
MPPSKRKADQRRRLQKQVERLVKHLHDERLHHRAAAQRRQRQSK